MLYSKAGTIALVLLRLAIGWHFFFEGMVKLLNPTWTSRAYLLDSGGFARPFFVWIANNSALLSATDVFNAVLLTLIGFLLILGFLVKPAGIAGICLLGFYYLSHPPFPGIHYLLPADGSYFIINKTLIELMALFVVISLPTEKTFGLERIIHKLRHKHQNEQGEGRA